MRTVVLPGPELPRQRGGAEQNYVEQGAETNPEAKKRRAQKLAQALRRLGYDVALTQLSPDPVAEG